MLQITSQAHQNKVPNKQLGTMFTSKQTKNQGLKVHHPTNYPASYCFAYRKLLLLAYRITRPNPVLLAYRATRSLAPGVEANLTATDSNLITSYSHRGNNAAES